MAKATFIKEIENGRLYRNSKGKIVKLILNDYYTEITIFDLNDKQIGEFEFKELEYGNGYKLMRMYSNELKKTGIGSAILEYFIDAVGSPIYVSPNDGITKEDGSHLTGDALKFIYPMIREGLIKGFENEILFNSDDINGFF